MRYKNKQSLRNRFKPIIHVTTAKTHDWAAQSHMAHVKSAIRSGAIPKHNAKVKHLKVLTHLLYRSFQKAQGAGESSQKLGLDGPVGSYQRGDDPVDCETSAIVAAATRIDEAADAAPMMWTWRLVVCCESKGTD